MPKYSVAKRKSSVLICAGDHDAFGQNHETKLCPTCFRAVKAISSNRLLRLWTFPEIHFPVSLGSCSRGSPVAHHSPACATPAAVSASKGSVGPTPQNSTCMSPLPFLLLFFCFWVCSVATSASLFKRMPRNHPKSNMLRKTLPQCGNATSCTLLEDHREPGCCHQTLSWHLHTSEDGDTSVSWK